MKNKRKEVELEKDVLEWLDDEEIAVLERHGLVKRDANGKPVAVQELKVK